MTCFCTQEWENNRDVSHTFADGGQHCITWLGMYTATNSMTYLVPVGIGLVNFITSLILQKMSGFEKHHNISEQKLSAAINLTLI